MGVFVKCLHSGRQCVLAIPCYSVQSVSSRLCVDLRFDSPEVNSFHSRLDVVRYCGQVSEGAVHFGGDITGTWFGAVAARRQHSSQEQQGVEQPPQQVWSAAGARTHCARG